MLAYWAGMLAYRLLIFAGMVWLAQKVSPVAALVMLAIAVSLLLVRPALTTSRWLIAEAADPPRVKRRLVAITAGIAAFLMLVPLPAGIAADGIVEVTGARFVFPPRDVRVVAVNAGGDAPLLRLESPDLVGERALAAARQSEALERWRRAVDSPDGGSAQAAAELASG